MGARAGGKDVIKLPKKKVYAMITFHKSPKRRRVFIALIANINEVSWIILKTSSQIWPLRYVLSCYFLITIDPGSHYTVKQMLYQCTDWAFCL